MRIAVVGLGQMGRAMAGLLLGAARHPCQRAVGGFGASGFGWNSGIEALASYTQPKDVWVDTTDSPTLGFGYRSEG